MVKTKEELLQEAAELLEKADEVLCSNGRVEEAGELALKSVALQRQAAAME